MSTETKAVRDGVEARHDPQTFIAAFLDGARLLTPDPHFVVVENPGYVPDNGVDPYLGCETPMAVAILTEMLTGVSAAPSAAGGGAIPEGWALLPLEATEAMWQAGRDADAHPTDSYSAVWDAMVAAALSPSQGSDTGEAGREPGAYGIPGMPANLSNSDNLRLFSVHHADRLPKAAQDDLCRLADEWDEEIEGARRPVPPPTAPQGADLAGLSAKAYRGPWSIQGGAADGWIAGPESDDEGDVIAECPEFGCDESRARFPANAAFIVALVNAYRAGVLAPTTSAPRAPADREVIAQIIDPGAEEPRHLYGGMSPGYRWDQALAKADAILALAHPGSVAPTSGERDHETAALRDVLAERRRQVEAEKWSARHDDGHQEGDLAMAAACYALASTQYASTPLTARDRDIGHFITEQWPWQSRWWKPTLPRRDLVKAGALILAEIERLDRAAPPPASRNDGERP